MALRTRPRNDDGSFAVNTMSLLDISNAIWGNADGLEPEAWGFQTGTSGAQVPLDAVGVGVAWTDFTRSWDQALTRLQTAIRAYGADTLVAAAVYQQADLQSAYWIQVAVPPSPASPDRLSSPRVT